MSKRDPRKMVYTSRLTGRETLRKVTMVDPEIHPLDVYLTRRVNVRANMTLDFVRMYHPRVTEATVCEEGEGGCIDAPDEIPGGSVYRTSEWGGYVYQTKAIRGA